MTDYLASCVVRGLTMTRKQNMKHKTYDCAVPQHDLTDTKEEITITCVGHSLPTPHSPSVAVRSTILSPFTRTVILMRSCQTVILTARLRARFNVLPALHEHIYNAQAEMNAGPGKSKVGLRLALRDKPFNKSIRQGKTLENNPSLSITTGR